MEKINKQLREIKGKGKVTPFGKFRAIAISIVNFLFLYNLTKKLKLASRNTLEKNIPTVYAFTIVVVKNWFIDKFPVFFRNIINYEGSLDFTVPNLDYIEDNLVKKRFK